MNKIVLVVSLLALAVSGVNTALLLQIIGASKQAGTKIETVGKELEKVQPVLQSLSEKLPGPPPGGVAPPTAGSGDGKAKLPLPGPGGEAPPEPKGPPKLPFPPKD